MVKRRSRPILGSTVGHACHHASRYSGTRLKPSWKAARSCGRTKKRIMCSSSFPGGRLVKHICKVLGLARPSVLAKPARSENWHGNRTTTKANGIEWVREIRHVIADLPILGNCERVPRSGAGGRAKGRLRSTSIGSVALLAHTACRSSQVPYRRARSDGMKARTSRCGRAMSSQITSLRTYVEHLARNIDAFFLSRARRYSCESRLPYL